MSISVTTRYIWMQRQQLGVSGGKATTPSICHHGTNADGISDAQQSISAHLKDDIYIIPIHLLDPGSPHCLSSTLAQPPYLERIFVTTKRTKEGTSGYSTSHCDVDNPGHSQCQVPTSVLTPAPITTPTPTPTPGYLKRHNMSESTFGIT